MSAYTDFQQRKLLFQTPTTDSDILEAFGNDDEWLSVNQIANRVMRSASPQLRARIKNLVAAGKLIQGEELLANGYKKHWFRRVKA